MRSGRRWLPELQSDPWLHKAASAASWQDTAHDRKAAEAMPVFTAKQTHLCPHHRWTHRHFSPFWRSAGFSVSFRCLLSSTASVLGNCLVGLISFAGKTGSCPAGAGFTQVHAILEVEPVRILCPWSLLHREDLPCCHEATQVWGGCTWERSPAQLSTRSRACTWVLSSLTAPSHFWLQKLFSAIQLWRTGFWKDPP